MRNALQVFVGVVLIVAGVGVLILSLVPGPSPCSCPGMPNNGPPPEGPPAVNPTPAFVILGAILVAGGGLMVTPGVLGDKSPRK
jgi:multisubunit Na+/H+ antiporter MnhC subunit